MAQIKIPRFLLPRRYIYLYTILIAVMFVYERLFPAGSFGLDTPSYIDAFDMICHGHVHPARTPVYPLFLGTVRWLTVWMPHDSYSLKAIMLIQWTVFFVATAYFRKLLEILVGRPGWVFWGTACFALCPTFWEFNVALYTESLSVSCSVFMLWAVMKCINRPTAGYMARAFLWISLLIYLRPSFLYLLPLAFCLLVAIGLKYRRTALKALVAGSIFFVAISSSVWFYCHANEIQNGVRSMSFVSTVNGYFALREAELVNPDRCSDPVMASALRRHMHPWKYDSHFDGPTWEEYHRISQDVDMARFERYVTSVMAENPGAMIRLLHHRLSYYFRDYKLFNIGTYIGLEQAPGYLPMLDCFQGLFLALIALCFFIVTMWRRHVLAISPLWIAGVVAGQFAVVLAGAQDEYDRLLTPCLPAWILLMLMFLSSIRLRILRTDNNES